VSDMANNKAAGLDGIPAEVYRYGDDMFLSALLDIFQCFGNVGNFHKTLRML